ncbi:MAG: HNH endonuclease [Selenomonadaceae bacterium]|nr:HNH endonuclease [Selenomonadaceae bacterium]
MSNGEIFDGYHVHHKDGNPFNNDISNPELLTEAEHRTKHNQKNLETAIRRERAGEPKTPEWVVNHLAAIRPKAAEWHRSDAGREWHRQHGVECAEREAQKPKVKLVCAQCGKEFLTPHNRRNYSKFCSRACYAKYRRDNGIDDETRICPICGKEFCINRFSKTKTCSRECGNISIGITRRNKSR